MTTVRHTIKIQLKKATKRKKLNQQLYISTTCSITNHTIYVNGQAVIQEDAALAFPQFAKKVYKDHLTKYPKFFKMDSLSKLAFLASEFLFKNSNILKPETENNIAIVLSNRASSLDTDRKHQASIAQADAYFPSPAVFVYTLPNIGIGEISIRHKLHSENAFFVFDSFNPDFLQKYAAALIHNQKANSVLCGWVDYDETNYHAFLYVVSTEGTVAHHTQNIHSKFKLKK